MDLLFSLGGSSTGNSDRGQNLSGAQGDDKVQRKGTRNKGDERRVEVAISD